MKARSWMIQYGVAILLAILLGAILGNVPLFRETTFGKLKASHLVQFLGYGGALVMVWLSGRNLASHISDDWRRLAPFRDIIMPLIALLIITVGYGVLLLVCDPFLGKTGKAIYNWLFVIGIVSASLWLIVTWFLKSAPMVASLEVSRKGKRQPA